MVNQTHGRAANAASNASDQNRKIFLGGLNYHTTDENLRKFCERFGKFTDCLVMRDADGKSRGFGFVTYEDEASVEEFMRARPHTIDNRVIDPKRAMPREDQNSMEAHLTVKKLFVAGLRDGINEQVLQDYFSRFGNVMEVLIMKQPDGKPRGFGFVIFDDYDAVDKAILGKPHSINGRHLDIKKAIPKEKMVEMGYSGPPRNDYRPSGNGPARNNYSSSRDDQYSNNWDRSQDMIHMGNSNSNYNSQPMPPYPPSQGYNSNSSNYNPPSASGSYPASYSTSMAQNPAPPMMNYDPYNVPATNNNGNMPYSSAGNPNNYPPAPPVPAPYSSNSSANYGAMNNQYNPPPPPPPPNPSGYKTGSPPSNSYGDRNDYGMMPQNYGGNNNFGSYNDMALRGGGPGPMRSTRGGGYSGNNNFGQRSAPYSTRGGRGGGRGRGRGQ